MVERKAVTAPRDTNERDPRLARLHRLGIAQLTKSITTILTNYISMVRKPRQGKERQHKNLLPRSGRGIDSTHL